MSNKTYTFELKIKFLTYWHCSSGSSGGSRFDTMVAKDKYNLPFVPGKTLKGHIRDMAESLKDKKFVNECFGYSTFKEEFGYDEEVLYKPNKDREGKCYFTNAILNENIDEKLSGYLYHSLSSTAIEENGIAKTGSLREIEAVVPLILEAKILHIPNNYKEKMKKAIKQVKRIGLNRTRGWGRCEIEVVNIKDEENV